MAVITLTSAAGAPGCTTTALALALTWQRRVLFVEADPAGTSLVPGWLSGAYDGARSLLNVTIGLSNGLPIHDLLNNQQVSAPEPFTERDASFLIGWLNPAQANSAVGLWDQIGSALVELDHAGIDVIVDAGRATQGAWPVPLLTCSDQVLMVCEGSHLSAVRTAPTAMALTDLLLSAGRENSLGLVVVERGGYSASEVAKSLNIQLAATMPNDPKHAEVLSHGWGPEPVDVNSRRARKLLSSGLLQAAGSAGVAISKAARAQREVLTTTTTEETR